MQCQCCPHTETSQLIYRTNQLTGFYMRVTLILNGLSNAIQKLPYKNLDKTLLFSRKSILFEKLKTSTTIGFNIFC